MIVAFNEVPAQTAPKEPVQGSRVLTTLLLRSFLAVDSGSEVWGSIFHFSDDEFAGELARITGERRLGLRLVAGDVDHEVSPGVRRFFDACVERGGVFERRPLWRRNHDKWFLFERLDWDALRAGLPPGAKVVGPLPARGTALYVGTGNLTVEDHGKNNAAILIPIDERFANALKRRFETLRLLYRVPRLLFPLAKRLFVQRFRYVELEDERFKVYLFPRVGGGDTLRELIERAQPSAGPVKVRICSNRWNRKALAETLLRKYREAPKTTQIEVIARGPEDRYDLDEDGIYEGREMTRAVADVLAECSTRRWQKHARDPVTGALVTLRGVDKTGETIDVPICLANIHSKYVLIEGPYGDAQNAPARRLVWVGSPNMVQGALSTSFEILIELKHEPGAYAAFLENFDRLNTSVAEGGLGATDPALLPGET